MQINVTAHNTGLRGGPEVWVQVLSNELVTWDMVYAKMSDEQTATLDALEAREMAQYHLHRVTDAEREDHGYAREEWWVWRKKGPVAEYNPILWNA